MGQRTLLAVVSASAMLMAPGAAAAAQIDVDSAANSSPTDCTLRAAIEAANKNQAVDGCAAGSAIQSDFINLTGLHGSATIELEGSPLDPIEGDTEIRGPSPDLDVDANGNFRVFEVASGSVRISDLTITGGTCQVGCGVLNRHGASLELVAVAVTKSLAETGASAQIATARGGAIANEGKMAISHSYVTDSRAVAKSGSKSSGALGGALWNAGTLSVDRLSVADSRAIAEPTAGKAAIALGGAIYNSNVMVAKRLWLQGNFADAKGGTEGNEAYGGAIANKGGLAEAEIRNSLITWNQAVASGVGPDARGGGLYSSGTGLVGGSTLATNTAPLGANVFVPAGTTIVASTIIAEPHGGENCLGNVGSDGFNLESEDTCGLDKATDLVATDPMFAPPSPLPIRFYALKDGSPAIDKGKSAPGETTSLEGAQRPFDVLQVPNAPGGDGSDIGAYEVTIKPARFASGPGEGEIITTSVATFGFDDADGDPFDYYSNGASSYQCSLDGGPFSACESPHTVNGLDTGRHSFAVRSLDYFGYSGTIPATRSFEVAGKAPERTDSKSEPKPTAKRPVTRIRRLPRKTFARRLEIRFGSNEAGARFRCRLDRAKWRRCKSPYRTKKLSFGKHTFRVRAISASGLADPTAAKRAFRVLRRKPKHLRGHRRGRGAGDDGVPNRGGAMAVRPASRGL